MNEETDSTGIELPEVPKLQDDEIIQLAGDALAEAGLIISKKVNAINQICDMIFNLKDPVRESLLTSEISTRFKVSKKLIKDRLKQLKTSSLDLNPDADISFDGFDGIDRFAAYKLGFFEHNNCYYFLDKERPVKVSNCTILPLFHIHSKTDNKRLVVITNEHGYTKTIDIQSKCFVNVEQFLQAVFNEGAFLFFGNKFHFMKILAHIVNQFPVCDELKTLGWQREGFYAWANGIFNGVWQPVDEYGITTHAKNKYFSAAFSCVYKDVREDDDEYESDRYFIYRESPITFDEWTQLMLDVYGPKARIAIAFLIASLFRDIIYGKYKIFPHLFLFGEKTSGKSQLAWSLSNFLFYNMPAFNLSSGTQVGFFRRLSRIINGICWWDEYSNDIDPRRIQTLKSAYDGMGHEKGRMTKDNRSEITKVNSSSIISGQQLPTTDDNALFTRSILLLFEKLNYTAEQTQLFDTLKKYEQQGLSSLVLDILMFRNEIDQMYSQVFTALMDKMKADLAREGKQFEERLVRNFCLILAPIKIILDSQNPLHLNFSFDEIYSQSKIMINDLSIQITSSESLSNFWLMIEYMLDNKMIEPGKDFEVKSISSITFTNKYGQNETHHYIEPKAVLFIRFTKIHPLYMEGHRRQFNKNGIDLVSLMHYIKNQPSYVGYLDSHRFDDTVTSCFAFDYGMMANVLNLQRFIRGTAPDESKPGNDQPFTPSPAEADDDLPF